MEESGFAIWFTGLPAGGKTTLAREVQRRLRSSAVQTVLLDSDEMRRILTPQPDYSAAERTFFYQSLIGLAAWLTRERVNVLIAATANLRTYRDQTRARIPRFAEVYVNTPLAVCEARDPKGIYAAARAGRADAVPGIGVAYEPPAAPEVALDLSQMSATAAAEIVCSQLSWLIQPAPNLSGK